MNTLFFLCLFKNTFWAIACFFSLWDTSYVTNCTVESIRSTIDNFLKTNADVSKIPFVKNISKSGLHIAGITIPLMRKLSKTLSLFPFEFVLKTLNLSSLDEQMLFSFCCSNYSKTLGSSFPFEKYICELLSSVDSWIVTDSIACPLFCTDKNSCRSFCQKLLSSKLLFYRRTAFILAMKYLLSDDYTPFLKTSILSFGKTAEYYLQMAIAWLLQCLYIDFKQLLLDLLAEQTICLDIKLKAISKIIDSRKTSLTDKLLFKQLRANLKTVS